MRRIGWCLFSLLLLLGTSISIAAEDGSKTTKKFLKKPLLIEDQGSFFIGGVPKVTNYATLPAPNSPNQALTPAQITVGQMYVQFQIPARKKPNAFPVIMSLGVRKTDEAFASQLEKVLETKHTEIDKILKDYGVPLLDRKGDSK